MKKYLKTLLLLTFVLSVQKTYTTSKNTKQNTKQNYKIVKLNKKEFITFYKNKLAKHYCDSVNNIVDYLNMISENKNKHRLSKKRYSILPLYITSMLVTPILAPMLLIKDQLENLYKTK